MEKLVFTENLVGSLSSLQLQVNISLPVLQKPNEPLVAQISTGHLLVKEKKWLVKKGQLILFASISHLRLRGMIYQLELSCDGQSATYYGEKRFSSGRSIISRLLMIWPITTTVYGELSVDKKIILEDVHVIKPLSFVKQILSFRFGLGSLKSVLQFLIWFSLGLVDYLFLKSK